MATTVPGAVDKQGVEGHGQAFVLGEDKASGEYVDAIKKTIEDGRRRKALAKNQIDEFGKVSGMDKAWDVDVYGKNGEPGLLQRRKDLQGKLAKFYQKYNTDPGDPSLQEQAATLEQEKLDLSADVAKSASTQKNYGKHLDLLNKDHEQDGSLEHGAMKQKLTDYRGMPLSKREDSTPLSVSRFNKSNFLEGFGKILGDFETDLEKGNIKTNEKNLLYETDADGNTIMRPGTTDPIKTPYYDKFKESAKTYIESEPLAIQKTKEEHNLKDINGGLTADQQAYNILTKDLEGVVDQSFKRGLASHNQKSEGDKKFDQLVGDVNENVPIKLDRDDPQGGQTTALKKMQARTEKPVSITQTAGDKKVFSSNGKPAEGLPTTFNFTPSDVVDVSYSKSGMRRQIVGQVSFYEPADLETAKVDLLKKSGAKTDKKGKWIGGDQSLNKDFDSLTEDEKDAVITNAQTMGKSIKTRTVFVPYDENKNIFGKNAAVIDSKMGELSKDKAPAKQKRMTSKSKSGKSIYSDDGGKTWNYEQ